MSWWRTLLVHALDGGTFYLPMMNANMADKSGLIRFVALYEFLRFCSTERTLLRYIWKTLTRHFFSRIGVYVIYNCTQQRDLHCNCSQCYNGIYSCAISRHWLVSEYISSIRINMTAYHMYVYRRNPRDSYPLEFFHERSVTDRNPVVSDDNVCLIRYLHVSKFNIPMIIS